MAADRVQRLVARKRARAALEPLRRLVRSLSEWERLEDADAIGVVRIKPGEPEASYASDLLDIVAQAVSDAGHGRVVEVFVTSSAETIHRPPAIGEGTCQARTEAASTPTSARGSGRRDRSSSAAGPTTRAD